MQCITHEVNIGQIVEVCAKSLDNGFDGTQSVLFLH